MRDKLIRFMYGRYGVDSFSKFLITVGLAVAFLSIFTRFRALHLIGWIAIFYSYFRIFSRNHPKRYAENQEYLKRTVRFRSFLAKQKQLMSQRKTHHIYTCPGCRQKIRVPRGKGRIEVRCPKCTATFIKRS